MGSLGRFMCLFCVHCWRILTTIWLLVAGLAMLAVSATYKGFISCVAVVGTLFIASHALAEAMLLARAASLLRRMAPQPMGKIRLPGGISISSALLSFLSIALIVVFWVNILNPDRD